MDLLPPDLRVLKLAEPIQELGETIRGHASDIEHQIGTWEADVEAFNLILLAATHAIAVGDLARSSVSLIAPANALARAAMEAGARSMWLLTPDDLFAREARWLAHLDGEIGIRKRLEKALKQDPSMGSAAVDNFSIAVRAKLPPGTVIPSQVPKFNDLLKVLGVPEKYPIYGYLSQTLHATHHGTQTFRKHLGSHKELGDFATADDWWLPLSTTWWFLATSTSTFATRRGITNPALIPAPLQERFIEAQKAFIESRPTTSR